MKSNLFYLTRLPAALFMLFAIPASSGQPNNYTIKVTAGEFRPVTVEDDITRVAVAAPEIADYTVSSKREILINGKKAGSTTMRIWTAREDFAYTIEVKGSVGGAVQKVSGMESLSGKIQKIVNNPNVVVTYTDRGVIISGHVETELEKQKVEKVVRAYMPNPGKDEKEDLVTNVLDIRKKPQQVKIKVRVMEISEKATKTHGIDWGAFQQTAATAPSVNAALHDQFIMGGTAKSGAAPRLVTPFRKSQAFTAVDPFMAQINYLIDSGVIRVLAEPEIVALSGAKSDVLIGGQIPVVFTTTTNISVTWKDYGIKVSLEPNIVDKNRVTAKIYAEVSILDKSNGVLLSGNLIPAIKLTQATSEINVEAGKTVFLSGLKREVLDRKVVGLPGLSEMPFIGSLFGTHTKTLDRTDLVISVTPEIIEEAPK